MPFYVGKWLHQTITWATVTGFSAGVPVFSAQATMKARVELNTGLVVGNDGTEARYSHKLSTLEELPIDARVWMPGTNTADANEAMRPIASKYAPFLDGTTGFWMTFF